MLIPYNTFVSTSVAMIVHKTVLGNHLRRKEEDLWSANVAEHGDEVELYEDMSLAHLPSKRRRRKDQVIITSSTPFVTVCV